MSMVFCELGHSAQCATMLILCHFTIVFVCSLNPTRTVCCHSTLLVECGHWTADWRVAHACVLERVPRCTDCAPLYSTVDWVQLTVLYWGMRRPGALPAFGTLPCLVVTHPQSDRHQTDLWGNLFLSPTDHVRDFPNVCHLLEFLMMFVFQCRHWSLICLFVGLLVSSQLHSTF